MRKCANKLGNCRKTCRNGELPTSPATGMCPKGKDCCVLSLKVSGCGGDAVTKGTSATGSGSGAAPGAGAGPRTGQGTGQPTVPGTGAGTVTPAASVAASSKGSTVAP